jgi:hypothetical protein
MNKKKLFLVGVKITLFQMKLVASSGKKIALNIYS